MRKLWALIIAITFTQLANAQLIGLCLDTSNAPISGVQIYEKNSGKP